MIRQGFHIGNRDWWLMVYYDVGSAEDLGEVAEALLAGGMERSRVEEALDVLSSYNTGLTYTNYREHATQIFISKATNAEQMYDTIQHETRHAADHIAEYYELEPTGERVAYLQGEISRQMFPAAAIAVRGLSPEGVACE